MRRHIFCFLIFCVFGSPLYSHAEEQKWVWIMVNTLVNKYATYQGDARVTFDKNRFVAELFENERKDLLMATMKGEIKEGKVVATVVIYGTDVPERKYSGSYQKVNVKGAAIKVSENMNLTDNYSFIGISRAY